MGSFGNFHGLLCIFVRDWAELCIGCGDLAVGGLGQTKPIILIMNGLLDLEVPLGISGVWWLVHVRPMVPDFRKETF